MPGRKLRPPTTAAGCWPNWPLCRSTGASAHFTCHLALADPTGLIRATSEGRCHGRICTAPAGDEGFGYDPLFEIVEFRRTFAELGLATRGVLSHRARAMEKMIPQIAQLLALDPLGRAEG